LQVLKETIKAVCPKTNDDVVLYLERLENKLR
jgi:hypothetical protein